MKPQIELELWAHLLWISVPIKIQIECLLQREVPFWWMIWLWKVVFECRLLHFHHIVIEILDVCVIIGLEKGQTSWRQVVLQF